MWKEVAWAEAWQVLVDAGRARPLGWDKEGHKHDWWLQRAAEGWGDLFIRSKGSVCTMKWSPSLEEIAPHARWKVWVEEEET